jgi:hypothetical protein
MTYNNSDVDICSWPYYLRDLANFKSIYNVAQAGAGTTHIFNSIINEVEYNEKISPEDTQIIVMWSGLTRTDTISTQDITTPWHNYISAGYNASAMNYKSNSLYTYHFNDQFATLSLFNGARGKTPMDDLCRSYKRHVSTDATIYESMLKIKSLKGYLDNKGFNSIFTIMYDPSEDLKIIDKTINELDDIPYLLEFATEQRLLEGGVTGGHPVPDGYLRWTKEHLIPYLIDNSVHPTP